jgi:hypothetical protein
VVTLIRKDKEEKTPTQFMNYGSPSEVEGKTHYLYGDQEGEKPG